MSVIEEMSVSDFVKLYHILPNIIFNFEQPFLDKHAHAGVSYFHKIALGKRVCTTTSNQETT